MNLKFMLFLLGTLQLASLASASSGVLANKIPCSTTIHNKIFSLNYMDKGSKFFTAPIDGSDSKYLTFRVCSEIKDVTTHLSPHCESPNSSVYYTHRNADDEILSCKAVTPLREEKATTHWKTFAHFKENSTTVKTFELTSSNENLNKEVYQNNVKFNLICDWKADDSNYKWKITHTNGLYIIETRTKYACGVGITDIVTILEEWYFISIPVIMLIGAFLCFAGQKIFKLTLFISGFLLG